MRFILGIDPGISGALALFDPESGELQTFDMPAHKVGEKRTVSLYDLAVFMDTRASSIKHAFVEQVNAMPGQGVTSMFNFGFAAGAAQMAVAASLIPITLVRPAVWKRAMNLSSSKDESRRRASQLFPHHINQWARVKDDGRAEAALLAYYGANCCAVV